MAVNVINPNKGRVYLSKEGLQLDSANLDKYHPNSNVNTLQVNIEDGGVLNTMAMINYQTPSMASQSQAITSHWYPLFFIGINNVKVANESGRRTFAQYLTPLPVNILNLNLGRSTPMNVKATVKLVGGVNFKGVFDSLGELQAQIPPTIELDEDYSVACVIDELGNVDYYQVDETSPSIYEWVKNDETINPILSLLESKQYNISNISVQGGFGNATPLPLATQHYQILWQAINNQGNAISDLDNKYNDLNDKYYLLDEKVDEVIDDFNQNILELYATIEKEKKLSTNILDTYADIVFDNKVINDRRFRGWKAIGEVPYYLRKDEIGTNRIQGSALVGDEIFWIGGTSITSHVTGTPPLYGASNRNVSYNIKTNEWHENPLMPKRKDTPTLVSVGTDVYILGSIGRENKFYPFDSVFAPDYKYDTITKEYTQLNSLEDMTYKYVSVQASGADHLDGKIYISGRYWLRQNKSTNAIDLQTTPRLAIYDIATDTWEFGPTPPMSNDGGSSKIVNRKFYVYRNTFYAFDIDSNTWSGPLNVDGIESRSHTSMATIGDKIYVIGGYISGSSPVRTSGKTYVYDTLLDTWSEDTKLNITNNFGIGISYLMAVVWNGKLVIYGGTGKDENIYGPETDIENQFANWYVFIEDYKLEKDLTPIYEKSNQELNEHIEDLDNPHAVTAEQVDTYVKTTIDNKDANTLQQAKDYTYSQVEIDNKDTAIMNKANDLENANMFKDVSYNNVNGVLTFTRYDDTTKEIDLPLELLVQSGYYDETTNELVLVLANGSEIRIPVGNLLTDLDAHNIRFNGSGTNYLVSKIDVESAIKELDTRVKTNADTVALKVNTSDIVDNLNSTETDKPLSANQGKILNDTTAKLTVSNVFTQPQQVPNATLPQHATNLSQVETMFEMFKQQLRGYNFAIPDLTGATDLGGGWYRLGDNDGIIWDYNVYTGNHRVNGTKTNTFATKVFEFSNLFKENDIITSSIIVVSGSLEGTTGDLRGLLFLYGTNAGGRNNLFLSYATNSPNNNVFTITSNRDFTDVYMDGDFLPKFTDFTFKLQLEKGSQATPYTLPGEIPQYKIVGES